MGFLNAWDLIKGKASNLDSLWDFSSRMVQTSHSKTSDVAQLGEQNPLPGADKGWEQWEEQHQGSQWYLSAAVKDAVVVLGHPGAPCTVNWARIWAFSSQVKWQGVTVVWGPQVMEPQVLYESRGAPLLPQGWARGAALLSCLGEEQTSVSVSARRNLSGNFPIKGEIHLWTTKPPLLGEGKAKKPNFHWPVTCRYLCEAAAVELLWCKWFSRNEGVWLNSAPSLHQGGRLSGGGISEC